MTFEISREEKVKIILRHSSTLVALISGLLSGLVLAVALFAILKIGQFPLSLQVILTYAGLIVGLCTLGAGVEKFQDRYEIKVPLAYIAFGILFTLLVFERIFGDPEIKQKVFQALNMRTSSTLSWAVLSLAVVIITFSLLNPFETVWKFVFKRVLAGISPVNYLEIYGETFFSNMIQRTVRDAARFKVKFSVLKFQLLNYDEVMKKLPSRLRKMINELFYKIGTNTRQYDQVSFIKGGQFLAIIAHGDQNGSKVIGERLKKVIESLVFEGNSFQCCYETIMYEPGMDQKQFLTELSKSLGVTINIAQQGLRRV